MNSLDRVIEERPCRATGILPAVRLAEEAPRLRPLRVRPEELALRIPVYVGPTGTVPYDGHGYSMPPEAISRPATLFLYGDRVRIVAGEYKAEHPRKFVGRESSWRAEHRAALVAAVSGKRGKRYLKRQQLLELGETALGYLTELVHRRPRGWWADVDRLHDILQNYGPEVLREAMEEGLKEQRFDAACKKSSGVSGRQELLLHKDTHPRRLKLFGLRAVKSQKEVRNVSHGRGPQAFQVKL
jgi:hypothetical protein